jgi:hypothetical protein
MKVKVIPNIVCSTCEAAIVLEPETGWSKRWVRLIHQNNGICPDSGKTVDVPADSLIKEIEIHG